MGLGIQGPPDADEILPKGGLATETLKVERAWPGLAQSNTEFLKGATATIGKSQMVGIGDLVSMFKTVAQECLAEGECPKLQECPMVTRPFSTVRLTSTDEICRAIKPLLRDIQGVQYPGFIQQEAIRRLQRSFVPRAGDVFIVSHFPLRGLQRLLVSLIEGHDNPWEEGLLDKPHFLEGGASRRGVDNYLSHIASWSGRRCFKSHAFPSLFPCRWPIEHEGDGIPPKIMVLIADPRYAYSLCWEVLCQLGRGYMDVSDYIVAVLEHGLQLCGDYFAHARAWAQEALENPTTVRLFCAEKFASHSPLEVMAACKEVSQFLEMQSPDEALERLVSATFTRPADAAAALAKDCLKPHEAMNGGPLIELVGPRLEAFQDGLMQVSEQVLGKFREMLSVWAESSHPCLARIAEVVRRGGGSLMPAKLSRPLKGEAAHAAGECRPCVFNLRGICRNSASMCAYCHAEGHAKTKRASRSKRVARRTRVYTPSPDGLSS